MPVPQEKEIRRPLLELVRGESPQNFSLNDFLRIMASHFGEDLNEMTTADKAAFRANIKAARAYLEQHNLLSNPSLQAYMITKQGIDVLDNTTGIIDQEDESFSPSLVKERGPGGEVLSLPGPGGEVLSLPTPGGEGRFVTSPIDMGGEQNNREREPGGEVISMPEPGIMFPPELPELEETEIDPEGDVNSVGVIEPEETDLTTEDETPDASEDSNKAEDIITEDETLDVPEDSLEAEDIIIETEDMPGEDITLEEEASPEPEDITLNPEEDYTNGEEIMPDSELTQDNDELTEEYQDAAVIQSQSIEDVLDRHNSELADRVLMRAAGLSSDMFEVLVIDLLSKMGYRTFQNARYTNSASDDGMIQGVILDTQGSAPIYIHAKKLSPGRTVRRSEVKEFAEALEDLGGTGIFATTAEFSENATAYAQDERIMLIDGAKLAGLMIAHNFCVNVERVFEVKEIDEDSFNDYSD